MMNSLDRLDKLSVADVVEIMAERHPNLFNMFYPRAYEGIGQYHSPKVCAAYLTSNLHESIVFGFDKAPTANRYMLFGMRPMIEKRMPFLFIDPNLLRAVEQSDFKDDIDWTKLKLPYEHGAFILPRGGLVHPNDGDVAMISWSRIQANVEYRPPLVTSAGLPPMSAKVLSLAVVALCPETGMWHHFVLNTTVEPIVRFHNLFHLKPGEDYPQPELNNKFSDAASNSVDREVTEKIAIVFFGTILAMNARPELTSQSKLIKRVSKADKIREFWTPNVVGSGYKPRVVKSSVVKSEQGTHASPRMHWRRGHFRNQAFGVGFSERKTIWLEPVLVGEK